MVAKFRTTWVNRQELLAKLDLIDPNIQIAIAGMQMKVARDLAEKIKKHAPVGRPENRRPGRAPGTYRDSIHAARLADHPGKKLFAGSGSIQMTKDPNATGIFAEWIWHFLEFGTNPHAIRARSAPLLVFRGSDGQLRSATEVSHPGSPRQPHIFPVYRAERKNMRRRIARAMRVAIKRAMEKRRVTEKEAA
jgi:hypothetical protein